MQWKNSAQSFKGVGGQGVLQPPTGAELFKRSPAPGTRYTLHSEAGARTHDDRCTRESKKSAGTTFVSSYGFFSALSNLRTRGKRALTAPGTAEGAVIRPYRAREGLCKPRHLLEP